MKNLFKPEILKWIIFGLVLLLIVKLLWFIAEITLLSAIDIDQKEDHSSKPLYYRVKLTPNEAPAPRKVVAPVVKKATGNIREITLLAIYSASDISVVTVEYKHKSKVLSTGDAINGFILKGAGNNYAVFEKNGKEYKVLLDKKSKSLQSAGIIRPASKSVKHKDEGKRPLGEVTNEGSVKIIDRSLLEHYAENMDDIYKNIGISEIKNGEDIKGFKINFVRKDSPFAKLGIRRNDVIKSINGEEINGYNAAFKVYKNIKNANELNLVIQRGKEEMELDYEIN